MKVVLLRVGVDSGRKTGGFHGPLFANGEFEYVPKLDNFGVGRKTYGNTMGRSGKPFLDYCPSGCRERVRDKPLHYDPEFESCTYGDRMGTSKNRLRTLTQGDMLVFYCGLEGWYFDSPPALYLMGYLEVLKAGLAIDFTEDEIARDFANNAHLEYRHSLPDKWDISILVKGSPRSRLLTRAVKISESGRSMDLSSEMQEVFGNFDGRVCMRRSPPRWVDPRYVQTAAEYVRSLE